MNTYKISYDSTIDSIEADTAEEALAKYCALEVDGPFPHLPQPKIESYDTTTRGDVWAVGYLSKMDGSSELYKIEAEIEELNLSTKTKLSLCQI